MLACYPIAATEENWLHNSIMAIILHIHNQLDMNQSIHSSQEKWLELVRVTLSEENCENLIRSTGVRDRVFDYKDSVTTLTSVQRRIIYSVFETQNKIEDLINGLQNIENIDIDYPDVHISAKELFSFCFEKLKDFGVLNRQYITIFNSLSKDYCPICGIERLMNPEETAQDQDHYLAKSIYPFSAANMRNIVPICRCCNRDYKKAIDILRKTDGTRRVTFDPYNCESPVISLLGSTIDNHSSPPSPDWEITISPYVESVETWDTVFCIRRRFKRDILERYFKSWLQGFAVKCENDRKRKIIKPKLDYGEIRQVLVNYKEDKEIVRSERIAVGLLEPLAFEFFLDQYDKGNKRIIDLVRDAVLGIQLDEEAA